MSSFCGSLSFPGLDPSILNVLSSAASGARVAIVGGAVRDLLLHRVHRDPWRGLLDLDVVVEGDADWFVRRLLATSGVELRHLRSHGSYGTFEIDVLLNGTPLLLDVATARAEIYPVAGGKPEWALASLEDDLGRRDFTINAIALLLSQDCVTPQLLDPHGGWHDLEERCLRWLHPNSLRDDPSRLVRAARYAARLGFVLAPSSLDQCRNVIQKWPWLSGAEGLPGLGSRLRMELTLLLEREPWCQALQLLQEWGGLALLDKGLQSDCRWRRRLHWAYRFNLSPLVALVVGATRPVELSQRLQLSHGDQRLINALFLLRERLQSSLPLPETPSQWCALLEAPGISPEAVALAIVAGDSPRSPLLRWWLSWRHIGSSLTGAELMAREDLSPGPAVGVRLRQLRSERLDQFPLR